MAPILSTLRFIANHPLGSRKSLGAYLRYARWQIESRVRREVEFDWIEGAKLVARNGMTGATGNIYCGLHEFADMGFLLHLLRPGDLFVDVGANIGSYTVLASAVCGGRSIAVEPDPDAMQSLRRNVEVNGIEDRVTLVEAALGAARGEVRFTIGRDTMNRVTTDSDTETRVVQVRPLDEVLDRQRPLLIKLDVEGYEPEVLSGATDALRSPVLQALLTETADERIRSALECAGFHQAKYEPFSRDLSLIEREDQDVRQFNMLFVRDLDVCQARLRAAPSRAVAGLRI